MMSRAASLGLTVALVASAVGRAATAQSLRYEGGLALATGSYLFADRTTSWSLHSGLALTTGPVVLRAGLPLHVQNSILVTGTGIGMIPTGGSSSGAVADSGRARRGRDVTGTGMPPSVRASHEAPVVVPTTARTTYRAALGDPTAQLGLRVLDRTVTLTVSGLVKAPLADTATYGTGEWDFGAGASLAARLGGRALLGVDVALWRLGDMPELELRDPVSGTLALSALLGERWSAGVSLGASTSVLEGYDAPVTLGASLLRIGSGAAIGLSGAVGLTPTAPAVSLGLLWGVPLGDRR